MKKQLNKRDLIRFVGDTLHTYYKRGVLSIAPTYDTTTVDEDTPLTEKITEFFLKPYYELLEYRDSLKPDSTELLVFEEQHPKLEYEMGEVARLISGSIKEYLTLQAQAEAELDMLSNVYLDKAVRERVKEMLSTFGRVTTDARQKNQTKI